MTAETFERLALLLPDVDPSDEQRAAPLEVTVSVDFRGTHAGRLVVHASAGVLPTVAANMLGEDETSPDDLYGDVHGRAAHRRDALRRDALGELANVICGNLLPELLGPAAVVKLAAPRAHEAGDIASRVQDLPTASTTLGVDAGRVEVVLFLFNGRTRSVA